MANTKKPTKKKAVSKKSPAKPKVQNQAVARSARKTVAAPKAPRATKTKTN